jgi:hypothetical protein
MANGSFSFSDSMATATEGRSHVIQRKVNMNPNDCTSMTFDVNAHFGRMKEARAEEAKQMERVNKLNAGSMQTYMPDIRGRRESVSLPEQGAQGASRKKDRTSLGCKAVEAAQERIQERKRQAEQIDNGGKKGGKKGLMSANKRREERKHLKANHLLGSESQKLSGISSRVSGEIVNG